jgi:hypothetical protein
MAGKNSHHILNTSSNLLGFCLVVLTSLKISKYDQLTRIDEFTGAACVLLIASSLFSFLSIRSTNDKYTPNYEKIADKFFLAGLILVFIITFMIAFSIIF